MFWSFLFVIGLVQGIFLIFIFARRPGGNHRATRLLQALLGLFALSNFDDLLLSTGWYRAAPWLFGASLSAVFAYGPLFYLYIEAVTNPERRWRRTTGLHFLPAALSLLSNLAWLVVPPAVKTRMLDDLLAGRLPVRPFDAVLSVFQALHLGVYVWLAFRSLHKARRLPAAGSFQMPLPQRVNWLRTMAGLFSFIPAMLAALVLANLISGRYVAGTSFGFTLITSAILYFIAYQLMLHPDRVTPGFAKKYEAIRFAEGEKQDLLARLNQLLQDEQIYSNPEIKLATLASRLETPAHRLSTLINEHYGMSFSDLLNRRRIEAFLACLDDPQYAHFTLYGLALEVGFNSKSAFNAAFKKITGKSPSQFKGLPNASNQE